MATSVRGRQVNAFQALALLLAFVLMAAVGGLLAAGLILPAVAVTNGATDLTVTAFDDLPSELGAQRPLSEKSTMLAADGSVLATFYDENRIVVPLDQIAPIMRQAVLAVEDKRFYEHGGIDPTGMARATVKTLLSDQKEGASTLTQQYVKNVLIEKAKREDDREALEAARTAEGAEGISRKLREAKLAIALEKSMPKDQILENYLNIAQFGIAIYGVETAAQYYFSKPAAELNYLEAATIAGITQAPTKWDPVKNPADATNRRATVLGLMLEQKLITQEEHDAGLATPLEATLRVQPTKLTCAAASDVVPGAGYFCDYVTKVIVNDPAFGATPEEREELLYRGGLTIRTTLDPREQAIADAEVKAGIPVDDPSNVASAISVVEPGTGQIKAMAQNRIYSPAGEAEGQARQTAVNYNTDQAYGGSAGFAPGSTFKPFTLVQWLKEGHSLNESVNAQPLEYPMTEFNSSCVNFRGSTPPTYKFGNAENNSRHVMSVLDATKNSVNSGYIAMAKDIDLCGVMQTAKELGVHTGTGGDPTVVPANVLGTDSVAPLTMASAFATFASGGTYCAPVAITSVQDANGAELPIPSANCRRVLDERIANAMNFALSNVWSGTAKSVGEPPFPAAGKTGTTSRNENTWFVGYTPLRAAAVWVGFSEGFIPVQNITVNGEFVKYMFGSTVAAPTWKRYMVRALEGVEVPGFAGPSNDELYGKRVGVPSVVGWDAGEASRRLEQAGFRVSIDPNQVPSFQGAGRVAAQSPSGDAPAGSTITLQLSNGQQPQGGGQGGGQPAPGPGGGGQPNPGNGQGNGRP
ncbi:transglycosylase domain-containing protein [Cellulomonas cellasea]|uniref:Glycosyl transferase n=1 Tax=Cellulomonas cellasea DSM 20118 TaxID=1408250 RepID=A0A0A0B7Z6_9CELL|nr:transglycosylase domain-containing protein [Cellulomonas cellasea]KGM01919.1 glycosyl transferase [Cellulomonas cellasea DSM 20118]